jgi:hypothetical protein
MSGIYGSARDRRGHGVRDPFASAFQRVIFTLTDSLLFA